jgi:hypothetical protein
MAHILPDTLPQVFPKEVLRVFHALKALPDSYYVWHHLAPWLPEAPDFLVAHEDGRVLLVKVSSAAAGQASTAAQMLLLDDDRAPLGQAEAGVLKTFLDSICLPKDQQIEALIVFPNIPDKQVQASRLERGEGDPAWVGRELLQPGSGESFFRQSQARKRGRRFFRPLQWTPSGWKNSASALPQKWSSPPI